MTAKTTKRARKSYEARTGANKMASKILASAMFGAKPEFYEDEDGHLVRKWLSSESSSYTNADLRSCLQNRVAVEPGEMLGTVPPAAIKYMVTKGWLIPNAGGTLYFITRRAVVDLDLPLTFRGTSRKIRFAEPPARKG